MKLLVLLSLLSTGGYAGCVQVRAQQIHVRDLAQAVTAFDSLDPAAVFGFAPVPGLTRTISGFELQQFAARRGLRIAETAGICVEVPVRVLTSGEILDAVKSSVEVNGTEVELVDYTQTPVPEGTLVAAKPKCLSMPANSNAAPVLWRGWLQSAVGPRKTNVWAHVFIRTTKTTLVALRPIRPGETVAEEAVQAQVKKVPLSMAPEISDSTKVIGKVARCLIHQGEALRPEMVSEPQVIRRGQEVEVRIANGRFSIRLLAHAESSARPGEHVMLRNPESGKLFRALATSPGRARLDLGREVK